MGVVRRFQCLKNISGIVLILNIINKHKSLSLPESTYYRSRSLTSLIPLSSTINCYRFSFSFMNSIFLWNHIPYAGITLFCLPSLMLLLILCFCFLLVMSVTLYMGNTGLKPFGDNTGFILNLNDNTWGTLQRFLP